MKIDTPLRYPGGKSQLAPLVIEVLRRNDLFYGAYAEPFAGGCGIAWKLLLNDYVSEIWINDIDASIYAFWAAALRHGDALCELIERTPVTMKEWERQKAIHSDRSARLLARGFSTLFLNRTNRSGILTGGVIGGKAQAGSYKVDCRFNRKSLIEKVRRISEQRSRVRLTRLDAKEYLEQPAKTWPKRILFNIDPPYYNKGRALYTSYYRHDDHVALASAVKALRRPWMLTYDDTAEIRALYRGLARRQNELFYAADAKRRGIELVYFSHGMLVPSVQIIGSKAASPRTVAARDRTLVAA